MVSRRFCSPSLQPRERSKVGVEKDVGDNSGRWRRTTCGGKSSLARLFEQCYHVNEPSSSSRRNMVDISIQESGIDDKELQH